MPRNYGKEGLHQPPVLSKWFHVADILLCAVFDRAIYPEHLSQQEWHHDRHGRLHSVFELLSDFELPASFAECLGSFLQIILLCPLIKTSSIAVSHIGSHLYEGSYFEGCVLWNAGLVAVLDKIIFLRIIFFSSGVTQNLTWISLFLSAISSSFLYIASETSLTKLGRKIEEMIEETLNAVGVFFCWLSGFLHSHLL